jgi:mono/diheme cytochrome c family protein
MFKNNLMKKILVIISYITITVILFSCGPRRSEGRAYMPDMTYSRAYETYAPAQERLDHSSAESKPVYSNMPVKGTIARGDMLPYLLKNDSLGYALSAGTKNPLDLASIDMKEAERLYLVNCGICHGPKLDGNGPLYKDGNGPFVAKPATLVGDETYEKMAEGTMFHSITYGKNAMGSYASQLSPVQRWEIIAYIKSKQRGAKPATADSTAGAKADSASTAMK